MYIWSGLLIGKPGFVAVDDMVSAEEKVRERKSRTNEAQL